MNWADVFDKITASMSYPRKFTVPTLEEIKGELNDIEIMSKVMNNHCLMEWEGSRYLEIIKATKTGSKKMSYATWTETEKQRHVLLAHIENRQNVLDYQKQQVEKYQKLVDEKKAELIKLAD